MICYRLLALREGIQEIRVSSFLGNTNKSELRLRHIGTRLPPYHGKLWLSRSAKSLSNAAVEILNNFESLKSFDSLITRSRLILLSSEPNVKYLLSSNNKITKIKIKCVPDPSIVMTHNPLHCHTTTWTVFSLNLYWHTFY